MFRTVDRFKNGSDIRKFRGFDNSRNKRDQYSGADSLLWRIRKIVMQMMTKIDDYDDDDEIILGPNNSPVWNEQCKLR